jgi:hypothetical protein
MKDIEPIVPNWVPNGLISLVEKFLRLPKREKFFCSLFLLTFVFIVAEFVWDSFAPGHYLIARQLIFLPFTIIGGLCIRKMIRLGFQESGFMTFLFIAMAMKFTHDIRSGDLNQVFGSLIVQPLLWGSFWYWAKSQSIRKSVK